MSLNVFLKVVEIQTKLASLFPFILGILFSVAYFHQFHLGYTVLFFIGMLVFDMATTAINNYMDFQKAKSETYKFEENIIGQSGVSPALVRKMIFAMIAFSAVVGIFLSLKTGWLFLVMGGICCFIGIFYTFGPIPLSRMPLGEVFSGFTMGLGIFAMTIYLNVLTNRPFYLALDFAKGTFALTGNLWAVMAIVWASLPIVFTIANIMLANNLRDLDTDIENHRYTLVYYIGRPHGVVLFQLLMLASYAVILVGWPFGVYRWPILLVFLSLPVVLKNLKTFKEELPQPKSFRHSIKNLLAFNGSYALGLLLTIIIEKIQG
ncbi:1,4-dihydroxy-2-naphthoate polyprenyltransferase [Enterococcus rivorum]|uniref:1,4-dihydroxy-2-naphthoate polyprenyltransferase n=1 Tax=Enterococcus rivorum TaxID=762845 RepID=A0A1E5KXD5_9ENTE|nr:1,4-dihydroxy-2-naphthoate polyprenyltransferase [Enterococcus rivorum]MBP2099859.1 1,4-dihydroxy-2-naphthoate octaprenyltransferase [Enterococcus rivorum]OEH82522.1 1,4-dihydroxy-2-naphthoate polyprenyltransferase [Enterococcus rivorum]